MENKSNNVGLGIGLVLCGLVLLAFPRFAGLTGIPTNVFDACGLVVLLFGLLGSCVEFFRR